MARSSWGKIRQLPSGRFQASYVAPDKTRRVAPTTFVQRKHARLWLNQQHLEIERGTWRSQLVDQSGQMEFLAYARDHIRLQTSSTGQPLRKNTQEMYSRILELHLKEFHLKPICEIKKRVVDEWWLIKIAEGKPTTASKAYKLLHSILNRAVRESIVDANPCQIRGAQSLTSGNVKQIPTPQEVADLFEAINPKYRLLLVLMAYGGLRFSEATALEVGDFKLICEDSAPYFEVSISKAVTESNGKFTVAPPKSRSSNRIVPISTRLTPFLARALEAHLATEGSGLISYAANGSYIRNSVFRKALQSAQQKSGVSRVHLSAHCFRHFAATEYVTAGASIADLQTWLGDSTKAAALGYIHANKNPRQIADGMQVMF